MRFSLMLIVLVVLSGCAGGPKVFKSEYDKGSVLVTPARDVVQNGVAHEIGVGSGQLLTKTVASQLTDNGFVAVISDNPQFNHVSIVTPEQALDEANKKGTRYCLVMSMGEFRNAAPMSFRTDFVYLDAAELFDVKSGKSVWKLEEPILREKSNVGNHLGLIKDLAGIVAKSIAK